jgi:catalase-peroxidase
MGPRTRYLGADVPKEVLIWQDPVPAYTGTALSSGDIADLKAEILKSGLTIGELVATAWASASTYRGTDKRGGANGGRIRLAPQKFWEANNPTQLSKVLDKLEVLKSGSAKNISMADMIVLGGTAAVEKAAYEAGYHVQVPFTPGRTDATQEMTDVDSFAVLEPELDGFRNYRKMTSRKSTEDALIDKAHLLSLTAPEMTVLVGGMRAMGANYDGSNVGVFTKRPGQLTQDYFVNLLDYGLEWHPVADTHYQLFNGTKRGQSEVLYTASRADLIFGSNTELRSIAEVYGSHDAGEKMVKDFVAAWVKVMNLDRFDVKK